MRAPALWLASTAPWRASTLLATSNLGNGWDKVDVLPDVSAAFYGVFYMISDYTSGGPAYIVGES
jgi:hypothetical protein